jgi:GR25 family glycosyltransferase involved in LPS biosynthesis
MKYKVIFFISFVFLILFFIYLFAYCHSFSKKNTNFILNEPSTTPINYESSTNIENYEPFNDSSINQNINYYVITMKKKERMDNIDLQLEKLKTERTPIHLEIVDAVVGLNLDLTKLLNEGILSPNFKSGYQNTNDNIKKREIGCYMSHLKMYDKIKLDNTVNNNNNNHYSVIFEDDIDIVSTNFLKEIEVSINFLNNNKLDFDVIYLGTLNQNHGESINNENLYKIDKNNELHGTHGMLINNKNIDKLLTLLKPIKLAIDNEYSELIKTDKINAYVIYPHIVNQQVENLKSTIILENFNLNNSGLKYYNF